MGSVNPLRHLGERGEWVEREDDSIGWPELSPAEQYGIKRAIAHEVPTAILLRVHRRLLGAHNARGLTTGARARLAATRDELRRRGVSLPRLSG